MIWRSGFILLLIVQISLLLLFVREFQMGQGQENSVTLSIVTEEGWGTYQYSNPLTGDEFLEFSINYIDQNVVSGSPSYSERLYVLIKKQDDIYEVNEASTTRLQPKGNNEVTLVGKYMYEDEERNIYYVDYGFENIESIDQYGDFMYENTLKVTLQYGEKWNQYKIKDIEKVTK